MNRHFIADLLTLFEHEKQEVTERFDAVNITLTANKYKALSATSFSAALNFLDNRDSLHIAVVVDDGDPLDFYSNGDVDEFVNDFENKLSVVDDETIKIIIDITKNIKDGILSLYFEPNFYAYLATLSLQALFQEFDRYIEKSNFLIFEFQNAGTEAHTNSIWFVNKGNTASPIQIDRQPLINKAKSACYYNLIAKHKLTPDDFVFEVLGEQGLGRLFNVSAIALSAALLFDIVNIQNNSIEYRLNGYKSINGSIDFSKIEPDNENQYVKIFRWVYDSGNFVDKIGLARNIISLHLEKPDLLELKGDPFLSIQSSYKVYEKQNIKQYIEIRNKISDQLLAFHDRANKIIETFASGFQKSALALISFYISAIILKVLGKESLVNVFTIDAAILSTTFIACSVIYFFVLRWEVVEQRKRFEGNYNDVKKRYRDLLDDQDIDRILNNDNEFNVDVKFIDDKQKRYTLMWFAFLSLFFAATWLLYFIYNPALLLKITAFFSATCSSTCR